MDQVAHLRFERTIGSGTFGKVRRAVHIPTGRSVAVKILNKHRITNKKDALRIEREISILKRIDHPNLLKLFQLIETPKSFMLVTQLAEGEELYQRINRKGGLPEEEAGEFFVQLLDGILHLRNHKIAHRDIKPENIIVEGSALTLIDFGLGNIYSQGERLNTSCGSHCYAAPEMMSGKSYDPQKTEVWALGVTLYAMLSGKLPFEHQQPPQLLKLMLANHYEELPLISSALQQLLRGMIEAKPSKRLNLEQIKQHVWVKARLHEFVDQSSRKTWNEKLLNIMEKECGLNREQIIWRISEGFGEESIMYHLRNQDGKQELPFHSGAVHLKFVFKSQQLAHEFINGELPDCHWVSVGQAVKENCSYRIKQIKGGFFYVCRQTDLF